MRKKWILITGALAIAALFVALTSGGGSVASRVPMLQGVQVSSTVPFENQGSTTVPKGATMIQREFLIDQPIRFVSSRALEEMRVNPHVDPHIYGLDFRTNHMAYDADPAQYGRPFSVSIHSMGLDRTKIVIMEPWQGNPWELFTRWLDRTFWKKPPPPPIYHTYKQTIGLSSFI